MSARRLLSIAAAVGGVTAIAMTMAACGGNGKLSDEQVTSVKSEALKEFKAEQRQRDAEKRLRELDREITRLNKQKARSAPGSPGSGGGNTPSTSSCGGGLSVNSVTSCPFAANVADSYRSSGGASIIDVYSPVTGRTYTMNCSGGVPVACSGGNGAAVYIR
jgi:hypothetical protein